MTSSKLPEELEERLYTRQDLFDACIKMYWSENPCRKVSGSIAEHIQEWFDETFPLIHHTEVSKMENKTQVSADIEFLKTILPIHYTVHESKTAGSIHCKSEIGIRLSPYLNPSSGNMVDDAEDEEHWGYVFNAIKAHFTDRFQEVFHNTCFCHIDFVIYLNPQQ